MNKFKNDPLKGLIYSLMSTILLSTNFITAKYALEGFNPETFSLLWTLSASIYSLTLIFLTNNFKKIFIPGKIHNKIILIGLVTGIGMILGWSGLARLDPSFASFLARFRPVITILLSIIFLKERFIASEIIPILIIITGAFVSAIGRWDTIGVGMILVLLSACMASVQMLIAKMIVNIHRVPSIILSFYRVFIAFIIILLWNIITGKMKFDVQPNYYQVTFLGAFLGPCLSWILMYASYSHWDLSRSSIIHMSQPLFVLPMAYFILRRLPATRGLYGGVLILIGAFWLTWIQFAERRKMETIGKIEFP